MTNGAYRDGLAADLLADLVVADAVEADVVSADQARPRPTPHRAVRAATAVVPAPEPVIDLAAAGLGVSGYLRFIPRDWRRPSLSAGQHGVALQVGPLRAGFTID